MKTVLHLSNTPLSNAPANLVQCLQTYGRAYRADLILALKSSGKRRHSYGLTYREHGPAELRKRFERADVIHFHNFTWEQYVFLDHPDLLPVARSKPCLVQFHSPRNSYEDFEHIIADPTVRKAVIAQYHVRQYPEAEFVVPNVVPIESQPYLPAKNKWDSPAPPVVSYAPSNARLKGWDDKGYRYVVPVLDHFESLGAIRKDLIYNRPYDECMQRKQRAHIGIDEFVTGSYHLSSLEYLAMGCAVFGSLDARTKKAVEAVAGRQAVQNLPWHETTPSTFNRDLGRLLQHPKYLKSAALESRRWIELYWHPRDHVEYFESIYKQIE